MKKASLRSCTCQGSDSQTLHMEGALVQAQLGRAPNQEADGQAKKGKVTFPKSSCHWMPEKANPGAFSQPMATAVKELPIWCHSKFWLKELCRDWVMNLTRELLDRVATALRGHNCLKYHKVGRAARRQHCHLCGDEDGELKHLACS